MRRARPTAEFSRRQLLRLGITAAGFTLTPIAWSSRATEAVTEPASVDHAAAAQQAYRRSLARLRRSVPRPDGREVWESNTGTLASPPRLLRASRGARGRQADFDVLVVGSGYGGAVCAARLAGERRPGVKIAVLERGREWVPGTFPERLSSFNPFNPLARRRPSWLSEQLSSNPLGLFGFHMGDVPVVTGNGLGGASLTNCAVALEAKDYVFGQEGWPDELRSRDALRPYYERASRMLAPRPTPEDRFTPKLRTHLGTADNLVRNGVWRAAAYRAPLAITFDAGTNAQGMWQHGCVQCGDCATGCNVGAKNSLDMNYLPLAWSNGVVMFTQVEVTAIHRSGELYRVDYVLRPDAGHPGREERGFVTAAVVVVAAGTMGSNAILLRSRQQGGLATSDWLGRGFSANGNYLGFVDYQYTDPAVYTDTAGRGVAGGTPRYPVGAYIEGNIDFRDADRPLERRVIIEDTAQASLLAPGVALIMLADLERAMTLLGCGHDRAEGEIRLDDDDNGVSVHWPDYEQQPSHRELVRLMEQYAGAYGGKFRPFTPARNYTAHPLGGCRMAPSVATGVVNHRGQVFDPSAKDDRTVHAGLYVADASIIPTAVGNNPLLTITALAERIADLIVTDPSHAALFQHGPARWEPGVESM
jgi:cholesterol oxidase